MPLCYILKVWKFAGHAILQEDKHLDHNNHSRHIGEEAVAVVADGSSLARVVVVGAEVVVLLLVAFAAVLLPVDVLILLPVYVATLLVADV